LVRIAKKLVHDKQAKKKEKKKNNFVEKWDSVSKLQGEKQA